MSNFLREAIDDIRQKVVEEPWFGREVTDKATEHDHEPAGGVAPEHSHETAPAPEAAREVEPTPEPERELEAEPEPEHDIER